MDNINKKDLKILFLSSLGGALEYYDFILFVVFSQYIAYHFFPETMNEFWKNFFVYSAFASGYIARPLGGIVMAHFGDKMGRKNIFLASVLLMVIPTFLLSFLPTYATVGIFAPLFLVFIRIAQGISIGGEVPCSWVFISEHTSKKYHGIFLGVLTASIALGILLGSVVSLILHQLFSYRVMQEWGWRIPFFLGGIFGLISVYLRNFLSETPVFQAIAQEDKIEKYPLVQAFRVHRQEIILSIFSACVLAGSIISLILFFPKFIGEILGWDISKNNVLQIFGLVFYFIGCVTFGILRDREGIAKTGFIFILLFAISTFFLCYGLYGYLKQPLLIVLFYVGSCMSAGIVVLCPLTLVNLFSPQMRLSGISFSYNFAQALIGGIAPPIIFILHTLTKENCRFFFYPVIYSYFMMVIFFASINIFWFIKMKKRQKREVI